MIPVVAQPETVDKSRAENVIFFDGGNLPLGDGLLQDIVKYVGLRQGRVVVHIRPEEAVLRRNFFIDSSGEIIFANNLLAYELIQCLIPTANGGSVRRQLEHGQVLRNLIIDANPRSGVQ